MEFHTETRFLSFSISVPSLGNGYSTTSVYHIPHANMLHSSGKVAKHGTWIYHIPHVQLELKNNKPKPRLKNVFVWNCFLIIHLHLTWVIRGTGARTAVRGWAWDPELWDRPPRDTMWLVSGHGPWESQTPKLGSSKTTIPKIQKQENNVSNSLISTCLCPSLESWLLQLP